MEQLVKKKCTEGGKMDERSRRLVYKDEGQIWVSTWGNQRPLVWLHRAMGILIPPGHILCHCCGISPFQYHLLKQIDVRAGCSHADPNGLYR